MDSEAGTGKIIIVEDDRYTRDGLAELLREIGYEVCTAESGEQAMVHLVHDDADLLITDLRLPGMSGLELFSEVKALLPCGQAILMTAYDSPETWRQAKRMGFRAVVHKPVNIDQLLEEIDKAFTDVEILSKADSAMKVPEG